MAPISDENANLSWYSRNPAVSVFNKEYFGFFCGDNGLALMQRYISQKCNGSVVSSKAFKLESVDMCGNNFMNRSYLDLIIDSFQLMTNEVRNIGVKESKDVDKSIDLISTVLHNAPIVVSASTLDRIKFSILAKRNLTSAILDGVIMEKFMFCMHSGLNIMFGSSSFCCPAACSNSLTLPPAL
jgi:hypothetical protein